MRKFNPPFQFDFNSLLKKTRKFIGERVAGVTITLPFIEFQIDPNEKEKSVAREIVIRLADRRVLNAFECCDTCVERALASLQEIRKLLVDKQVELMSLSDGGLYLVIECIIESIRQFLTFEEEISFRKNRETYLDSLEMLRRHIHRCLIQISKIAEIEIPKIAPNMRYNEIWDTESYVQIDNGGQK